MRASHFPRITPKVSRKRKLTSPTLPTTTTTTIVIKGRRKIIAMAQAIQITKGIRKESLLLNTTSLQLKGQQERLSMLWMLRSYIFQDHNPQGE